MYSAYKWNKQGDNIQPSLTPNFDLRPWKVAIFDINDFLDSSSSVIFLDLQAKHLGHGHLLYYLENCHCPPFPDEIISAWIWGFPRGPVKVKWKSLSRVWLLETPWTMNSPGQNIGVGSLSQPRDRTQVSCVAGRFFTSWATGKPKNTGVGSLSLFQRISQPRNRIGVSCIAGRFFTNWAIREALYHREKYSRFYNNL